MMEERRRWARKIEETLVRFEGDNFSIYSRALNVSDRGAFVATHFLLDPGTQIQFHLIDPAGGESQTTARVVRTNTKKTERGEAVVGFGVEFLEDPTFVA
ncbi:MAG: PilZ domain-containing protein [Pseudomonadota bacterium]